MICSVAESKDLFCEYDKFSRVLIDDYHNLLPERAGDWLQVWAANGDLVSVRRPNGVWEDVPF